MIRRQEGFHLADLLSLRMRRYLPVPGETRTLSALMAHLTGIEGVPARFFPEPVLDLATVHVCEQYSWLRTLTMPELVRNGDWATFWAWVDTVQRRVGTEENDWGRSFPVEPIGQDKLTILISVEDVDGDYPEG